MAHVLEVIGRLVSAAEVKYDLLEALEGILNRRKAFLRQWRSLLIEGRRTLERMQETAQTPREYQQFSEIVEDFFQVCVRFDHQTEIMERESTKLEEDKEVFLAFLREVLGIMEDVLRAVSP